MKQKNIRAYFMGVPVRCDEYNEQLNQTITMEKAEEIVEKIRSAFWEYKRVTGKPPEVINVAAEAFWAIQKVCGLERMDDEKQIQLLKDAIELYEDGAIMEAQDKAIEFSNNITDFITQDAQEILYTVENFFEGELE